MNTQSAQNDSLFCDPTLLSMAITRLRCIAEDVRYSENVEDLTAPGKIGPLATIPTQLHVCAATLESEMRSWMHVDAKVAKSFQELVGFPEGDTPVVLEFPHLTAVATTVRARSSAHPEVILNDLRHAAKCLDDMINELPQALRTSGGRAALDTLSAIRDTLQRYAQERL